MNEKVKAYLEQQEANQTAQHKREKEEILIKLGLVEKKFAPDDQIRDREGYPFVEVLNGVPRRYKNVPIEISDEDFEKVKACYERQFLSKKEPPRIRSHVSSGGDEEKDPIAVALTVVAWIIFIGGFFAGLVLGKQPVVSSWGRVIETEFSFALACLYWVLSGITGLMFLGFGRIITLLNCQSEENQAQITILNEIADKVCNSKD